MRLMCTLGAGLVWLLMAPTIGWTQANANATASATDAFGYRSGEDTVGIYDEASVRGFSLEAAGNYRLEGTYFVKNSGVSYFFLESSAVRIGYNTLNTVIPGPSGVVDYRLRDPKRDESSFLTMTVAKNAELATDLLVKHRSSGNRLSFAVGIARVFEGRDQQGGRDGRSLLPAGTARITTQLGTLRLFGGEYQYDRPGQFRVIAQGASLPPRIERGRFLGQRWAMEQGERRIAGALFDTPSGSGRGVGGTFVFSQEDPTRGFAQLFSDLQPDGTARSAIITIPQQRSTAWSGEVRGHLEKGDARLSQRMDVSLRGRVSRARFGGTAVMELGRVLFGAEGSTTTEPRLDGAAASQLDHVDQTGLGVTYRTAWRARVGLNVGLLKTRYEKRVTGPTGRTRASVASPWLYNSALAVRVGKSVELYGTYASGLEEAGVAPATAANRSEVLPPIEVSQREVGVRLAQSQSMTLVVAGFDTRKPYAGVEGRTALYGLLGAVRHRGLEASVAGRPMAGLTLVIGAVLLSPRLSGVEVEAGRVGTRPVAVPTFRAIANLDYAIPSLKGLSLDGAIVSTGRRAARSAPLVDGSQLEVERLTSVNVGLRFSFRQIGTNFSLRAQLQNVFDQFSWEVNSSETLNYSAGRRARAMLTAYF